MVAFRGSKTNGSVSQFGGPNGLLQKMLDFVLGTEVTGEVLAGSGTTYTGTVSGGTPVGLGRFKVTYIISGTTYTATDDGSGGISGDHITTGTLNNKTGAYNLVFGSAPDSAPTVSYLYGESGRDWRLLYKRNTRNADPDNPAEPFVAEGLKECIIHNTGLSGQENVYLGFREFQYPANSVYGWNLNGYLYYQDDMFWNKNHTEHMRPNYDTTANCFTRLPMFVMIDDTMYYWLYSDPQRIAMGLKVQSNYETFYAGFYDRFSNPSDHPYPYYIKASGYYQSDNVTAGLNYATTTNKHRYCIWQGASATYDYQGVLGVYPDNSYNRHGVNGLYQNPRAYWSDIGELYETQGLKEILFNPVILYEYTDRFTFGELDQVVHLAGVGIQSEDLVNGPDGLRYRVFQDIHRNEYFDFMGIAEEAYTTTTTTTTTTTA